MNVVGSLSAQVGALERRLERLEHSEAAPTAAIFDQILQLHAMCHGPEDRNWCATCNCQWPCPTVKVIWP